MWGNQAGLGALLPGLLSVLAHFFKNINTPCCCGEAQPRKGLGHGGGCGQNENAAPRLGRIASAGRHRRRPVSALGDVSGNEPGFILLL